MRPLRPDLSDEVVSLYADGGVETVATADPLELDQELGLVSGHHEGNLHHGVCAALTTGLPGHLLLQGDQFSPDVLGDPLCGSVFQVPLVLCDEARSTFTSASELLSAVAVRYGQRVHDAVQLAGRRLPLVREVSP